MEFQTFLHTLDTKTVPKDTLLFAKRCTLDLIGVMAAGKHTDLGKIIADHAASQFGAGNKATTIMFDGRTVSPAGAALANGMTIDSIDAHDGFRPAKGHIGCHLLPALMAIYQAEGAPDGDGFLLDMVLGYEIGARAATALHGSVPDYHTSGAWGAVSSAAMGARHLKFDTETTRHAIGIAEYHGPRSQMMRCIDHPTMLKDGSGWGAMAGVSAVYLAQSGFTGAPAITIEGQDVADHWSDLGSRWTILEQYFKPYPVCRWAQPSVAAALAIADEHELTHETIETIEAVSFHEATRLATRKPRDTEQAQYSLPYSVAAALVFGQIGPEQVSGQSLSDPRVLRLSETMTLTETDAYNATFPADRLAHVVVTLKDGRVLKSDTHRAIGDHEYPLTDQEISAKFHALSNPVIGEARAKRIETMVNRLDEGGSVDELLTELSAPII